MSMNCKLKVNDMNNSFDKYTLIDMMFDYASIEAFKALWDIDNDNKKWGVLLYMCYNEECYERAGGDEGYKKNPPICYERLRYLEGLIKFLENLGVKVNK